VLSLDAVPTDYPEGEKLTYAMKLECKNVWSNAPDCNAYTLADLSADAVPNSVPHGEKLIFTTKLECKNVWSNVPEGTA